MKTAHGTELYLAMQPHTVLLIRTANLAWDGLHQALDGLSDVQVVGAVHRSEQALNVAGQLQPDLIVTGAIVAGNTSVVDLVRSLREGSPASRVVVIVDELDQVCADELLTLQGLGIEGQLLWSEVTPDRSHRCVLTVVEDGYVVGSRRVAEAFLDALRHRRDRSYISLSPRESQVLTLIALGETDQTIAAKLAMRPGTVDSYACRLFIKLGAQNRPHLVHVAWCAGLLSGQIAY